MRVDTPVSVAGTVLKAKATAAGRKFTILGPIHTVHDTHMLYAPSQTLSRARIRSWQLCRLAVGGIRPHDNHLLLLPMPPPIQHYPALLDPPFS